jgi:hypothetical protein
VIGQTNERPMKGFALEEYEIKLVPFTYANGRFKMKWDNQFQRPYCYELYSVGEHQQMSQTYAVTKDNWLSCKSD